MPVRWQLACLTLVLSLASAQPAPLPLPGNDPRGPNSVRGNVSQAEAQAYAVQIQQLAGMLSERYVKPVSSERLVHAAIAGLYQEAQMPLPLSLGGDPEKALSGRDLYAELVHARKEIGSPEGLRGEEATRVSIRAMLNVLDPYSTLLTPEDRRRTAVDGSQFGIGLTLGNRLGKGPIPIQAVTLGGPAQQAGLTIGDLVVEINGRAVDSLTTSEAQQLIDGQADRGGDITLLVQYRRNQREESIKLRRRSFREESVIGWRRNAEGAWDYRLDAKKRLGYIRLTYLTRGTAADLSLALAELKRQNAAGLILDLRDCPGGFLDEAVAVADLFLKQGTITEVKARLERLNQTYTATERQAISCPLVVLIGPETTGAGELIAAALQDHQRAAVAGQRSRGKSSVQHESTAYVSLPGGHAVKFTVGLFARPSGKPLNRFADSKPTDPWGIDPDDGLEVRQSAAARERLAAWRRLHESRPADSREALPLDDPEADPVLLAAVRHLTKE